MISVWTTHDVDICTRFLVSRGRPAKKGAMRGGNTRVMILNAQKQKTQTGTARSAACRRVGEDVAADLLQRLHHARHRDSPELHVARWTVLWRSRAIVEVPAHRAEDQTLGDAHAQRRHGYALPISYYLAGNSIGNGTKSAVK
eukprot:COSAG06_NODE_4140_length_4533_cov_3.136446_8_plen_143_part_00